MKRIITISREFGSGGRELGKRLADVLGIPCYDHQIIEMVAEKEKLNKDYVARLSEKDIRLFYPTTIGGRFSTSNYASAQTVQIAVAEHDLIKKLADEGDCIIVGRAADAVLADKNPFNIFVYANEESKLKRCKDRAKADEHFSDREILRKCRTIDQERRSYHRLYTANEWGKVSGYDLCINTSNREIKSLILPVAAYVKAWYESIPNVQGRMEE